MDSKEPCAHCTPVVPPAAEPIALLGNAATLLLLLMLILLLLLLMMLLPPLLLLLLLLLVVLRMLLLMGSLGVLVSWSLLASPLGGGMQDLGFGRARRRPSSVPLH